MDNGETMMNRSSSPLVRHFGVQETYLEVLTRHFLQNCMAWWLYKYEIKTSHQYIRLSEDYNDYLEVKQDIYHGTFVLTECIKLKFLNIYISVAYQCGLVGFCRSN